MKEIPIKKYVRYLFGAAVLLFILNKLYLRPWILENDLSGIQLVLTHSIPNLLEAVIGTLILMGILLQIRQSFLRKTEPFETDPYTSLRFLLPQFMSSPRNSNSTT